jgi:hypothetical protein
MRASGEGPGQSSNDKAADKSRGAANQAANQARDKADDARAGVAGKRDARADAPDKAAARPDAARRDTPVRQPAAPPRRPKWPVPLAVLGLIGLALAAILAGISSNRKQLPADYSATRQLDGTANVAWNNQALSTGSFGNVVVTGVPITGQVMTRVLATDGGNARVNEVRSISANGQQVFNTDNTYAVDRRTFEPASNPPADWGAQQAQGLTVGFPAGAGKQDYQAWVQDTQSTTTLRFAREESRGGVNTFVYESQVAAAPITDQQTLANLPQALPRAGLTQMTPNLPLTAQQRTALTQALPTLPDPVPLTYLYGAQNTYWVEPTTGRIVDSQVQETREATIAGPGGATVAALPVFDGNSTFTDQSVAAAGSEALDRRNSLNASGRTWPWVLGTLGALALIAGLLGLMMRRRTPPAPVPPTSNRPTEPTRPGEPPRAEDMNRPRPAAMTDVNRPAEGQRGEPQAPYTGQTQHTGPYRESSSGEPVSGDQQGAQQQPGQGKQPPNRG